ncbi:MAG: hypothetical protein H8E44_48235 [Planctomycetes bacterium]|nr:hypothetical protein [Planctomycetota bacterium]MBL7038481.1 hypothetical protein [Pirellulaceae bacterium]
MADNPPPESPDRYPDPREIRRLMVWGVVIIGGLLLAAAVFAGLMQESDLLRFEPVDPIRLAFVVGGTAVASILSLIALYSAIVRGHLAPFVSVMALIAFGLSAYLIMAPNIGEMQHARGVITVIFSVGTISIALILVMAVLFSKWSGRGGQDLTDRFDSAKQVLTMLLGILGTIVGFYFGSTTDDAAPGFSITDVSVSDLTPEAGTSFTLTATLEDGKPPFGYSVKFDATGSDGAEINDLHIKDIIEGPTDIRSFQHEVSLENVTGVMNLGITLTVTDDNGDERTYRRKPGTWVKIQDSAEAENEPVDDGPIPDLGST